MGVSTQVSLGQRNYNDEGSQSASLFIHKGLWLSVHQQPILTILAAQMIISYHFILPSLMKYPTEMLL